jgi:hypothetical protein
MSVLKGNKSLYDYEVSDALAHNLKSWLQYGFLEMGGYTVVSRSGATSGLSNLQRVYDNRYGGEGRIYEGMGPAWVWENDVTPIPTIDPPLVCSGIYVNNAFVLAGQTSGLYQHKIDFRNGRIIFASGISSTLSVRADYTFHNIGVYHADDPKWLTIVQEYQDNYNQLGPLSPSGMAQILKDKRVWLPSVFVDVVNRTTTGLQLGGGEINNFDVDYHIFADSPFINRRLCDTLNNQYQKVIDLFDVNNLVFPYNYDGSLASGAITYPNLGNRESPYFWSFAHVEETSGLTRQSGTDVYRGECSMNINIDRYLSTY